MKTRGVVRLAVAILVCGSAGLCLYRKSPLAEEAVPAKPLSYRPLQPTVDIGGFFLALRGLKPWRDPTSLTEIQQAFLHVGHRNIAQIDKDLTGNPEGERAMALLLAKASLLLYEGDAVTAYEVLQEARRRADASSSLGEEWLYTIIYLQGVVGLRRGENENCLECRGEGACVFPLQLTARHSNPAGSRLAIRHFKEYLNQFSDDDAARWLLNLAYMTLGEHPHQVPPKYLLTFDQFGSEAGMGRFKDISHRVGVDRLNEAGGAIMDDFDNDGLLDLMVSSWDTSQSLAFYRNQGDGTFAERTKTGGLTEQWAGSNLVQADYNNDGLLDVFVSRGGWMPLPMRPSLLRNNGDGTFTDVTREAGLMARVNSISAAWADFDNDGFLDLFLCCEKSPNRLYRNRGDGTFEDVAARAGVAGKEKKSKGAAWLDFDNDDYPDLFVSYFNSTPQLLRNRHDGTFVDVTSALGISGPAKGFTCWAFDYDNDGWLDIFATCYKHNLAELVHGMRNQPAREEADVTCLYRNLGGKNFRNVSRETGVDKVFATMGANFADFDNDGYLDFYLGTGDPYLDTVVPNRMFKNLEGQRFADVTAVSGTGHLQKGHGVACGDWDRDGNVDLFMQVGGATPGDRYHNVLFQNPGQGNNWLTIKLLGKKTNSGAIGARIKVVTAGDREGTLHRLVGSGSSFGANPLQQTIGLGKAERVATLAIHWPTSRTTQVFHDLPVNQAIEVSEFARDYRRLDWTRISLP